MAIQKTNLQGTGKGAIVDCVDLYTNQVDDQEFRLILGQTPGASQETEITSDVIGPNKEERMSEP